MRIFFGLIGVLASILLGLYLGLYVCFVGGGIDIIQEIAHAINGTDVSALAIMWGVIKMAISGFVGYFSFIILLVPSLLALGFTDVSVKVNKNNVRFGKK